MKKLRYLAIITLLLSCNANKNVQNVTSGDAMEFIEASRQRIYPGQINKEINFKEHWIVVFKGPDIKEDKLYLIIDNYKIEVDFSPEKGVVFGSDFKAQTIEFNIEYPLSYKGELVEGKTEDIQLLFVKGEWEEYLILKKVTVLEPLIYPSPQG